MRGPVLIAAVLAVCAWFVVQSPPAGRPPVGAIETVESVPSGGDPRDALAAGGAPQGGTAPSDTGEDTAPEDTAPEDTDALTAQVLQVAYDLSEGAPDRHVRFIEALQTDRAGSTERLLAAFAALDAEARMAGPGRMLLHTLGAVGHADALAPLAAVATSALPPSERIDHHIDLRDEAARTQVMALDALEQVATRYGGPEAMGALRAAADALIADPDGHPALYAAAAGVLRRHAHAPDAMAAAIEARLPAELAHLAYIEFTESLD